jgi:hypothetical protein
LLSKPYRSDISNTPTASSMPCARSLDIRQGKKKAME